MRMRSLFSMSFITFYGYLLSGRISIIFVHFYKCFKTIIISFIFIQIIFIYKWRVLKINVSFLASNVMMQYNCDDYSITLIKALIL